MNMTFNDTYEIQSVIGRGGMSTVYLAEHKRLHNRWAVKEVRKQQGVRFDFLAEANILKRLQHPMLPRIVDIFEDGATLYIVEDYVQGISLRDYITQHHRIDEAIGIQWFRDLCDVLNYLHTQKPHPIIYRDMKPSNIMLQADGGLKLIDFGIAREYKQDSQADTTYIGTKGYAAPEQFGKAQTDVRTDIYSLGVTMYHLLTGKSPYEPPYQFVPARQLNPALSHGMEHILNKCIQPEPGDRYQSVPELLDDLNHSYRYDKAYQKVQAVRRGRIALVAVLAAAGIGLMAGGWLTMGKEKEAHYDQLLQQASTLYVSDYEQAAQLLAQAEELFPDKVEAGRQDAYALYLNGRWQDCIDRCTAELERHGSDAQTRLIMASAQFELGDYQNAAQGFEQGEELSVDNLRDYAVCLGRMGQIDQAEGVLQQLSGQGADPDVTQYVQGEIDMAQEEYLSAETAFQTVMDETDKPALVRRCAMSLGDLYRDCAALDRTGNSPVSKPAEKAVQVLSSVMVQENLQYDSSLWEALSMAYFEAYHAGGSREYLTKAAEGFRQVLELGVTKAYLYADLYTVYYQLGDYTAAGQALDDYQAMYPQDYMPHALRGMLLITVENQKAQSARDYRQAVSEYETAGQLIRSEDETTYYQQLGSLIDQLRSKGWL